ncbi:MAG: BlaI/MecI/CopY family transcriptional regulator [Lachnospiraceae bacterium]|nr:BlaI/MecI/CopY family transcriptional regulator [Lachnospiraceae bacterium]
MEGLKLCDSDYRFMLVVWEYAPVNSGELARLCREKLGWKKSTTYTQIKKMCEKGYIENTQAIVRVLIPKEQVQADESSYFVERTFGGSLPGFLTAFLGGKTISEKEAKKIKQMIDEHIEKKE